MPTTMSNVPETTKPPTAKLRHRPFKPTNDNTMLIEASNSPNHWL